jgi:microcystin-dependent protein
MPAIDKWLTPDLPTTPTTCRRVVFPAGIDWLAIMSGALLTLTQAYNFEQFGTATPEQSADAFKAMFDDFTFQEDGGCRVIGEIILYAGSSSPNANWLTCDGTSLLRSAYPDLFAVVGTVYGAADGTHFNLPDLRGRVAIDIGTGSGLTPRALGDSGGEEAHVLTVAEEASHSHADSGHTHTEGNAAPTAITIGVGAPAPSAIPTVGITGTGFASLSSSGGGGSHNTMQPFLALNYLIVAL